MKKLILCIFCVISLSSTAFADEITDSINEGLKNYKDGNYSEAISSLDYASQMIRQKKSSSLGDYMPEPLPGWKAEKVESQAMGGAMMGGMVSASKNYTKGNSNVSITVMTDSPLLQTMMMFMANPMMASGSGMKIKKINGQKAVVEYEDDEKDGTIHIVIANKVLLTVEGDDVSLETIEKYAAAVDFKKLENMK